MSVNPSFDWYERSDNRLAARVWIDAELDCFDGHFPGKPILPGIAQIDWAVEACEEHWGLASAFVGMTRVKFKKPVAPSTWLELALTRETSADAAIVRVRFAFHDGADATTDGVLHFRA